MAFFSFMGSKLAGPDEKKTRKRDLLALGCWVTPHGQPAALVL